MPKAHNNKRRGYQKSPTGHHKLYYHTNADKKADKTHQAFFHKHVITSTAYYFSSILCPNYAKGAEFVVY